MKYETIILGAGIAGLSANYYLEKGNKSIILEKNDYYGGLCHSFKLDGFNFDTFIHLSFTKEKEVVDVFSKSAQSFKHQPIAYNYYFSHWLKHPAQNNIFSLSSKEKVEIIEGFINRQKYDIKNYEEWLRIQFGDYFAEHFPMKYTKKYWTVDASELETKWVGDRIYQPPINQVLQGAFEEDETNRYYANQMSYPCHGGYQAYLTELVDEEKIKYNSKAVEINPVEKIVKTNSGGKYYYDNLVSTIPLPELCKMIKEIPEEIARAAANLNCTSGIIVSLGFNKPDIPKNLWYYIYDEDILPARVYSPSLKSSNNVPEGCSSIQAEYYYSRLNPLKYTFNEVLEKTIAKLGEIMGFSEADIIVKDVRKIDFANVIFTHNIYKNKKIVHDYLDKLNIQYAGRFGEWDYLWSDQSLLSGKKVAEIINNSIVRNEV